MEIPDGTQCTSWHTLHNVAQNAQLGTDVSDGVPRGRTGQDNKIRHNTTQHKMNTTQRLADINSHTKLRVSEIERLIRIHRIIVPPLSRRTIVRLCEEGTFKTAARTSSRDPYLIYEDSFLEWVKSLDLK
jgi:hypothetical protein